jgi:UDP-N-acetylmuramyl pentapeptide synthase
MVLAPRSASILSSFPIPFTDDASIENAMHCIAACLWLQVPVEKIAARVATLAPIAMRLELKAGINHCSRHQRQL